MKKELVNYQISPNKSSLEDIQIKRIRTFGRIKSRKLSDNKNDLYQNKIKKYTINQNLDADEYRKYKKFSFEIGFGYGDFIFTNALNKKDQLFFGCEPHINGVVSLISKLESNNISNVKISSNDARDVIEKFPNNFFDEIFILFPDPWPKSKHFKRRLINADFIDNFIANKIKKDGELIIATDHDSYKLWIAKAVLESKNLLWTASSSSDWNDFPDDWVKTKYQKKAEIENRKSVIFKLKKYNA